MKPTLHRLLPLLLLFCTLCLYGLTPQALCAQQHEEEEHENEDDHSSSRFSDEPIPLEDLPERPKPLVELGEPFLGTGTLKQGIRLPTGAVWQPSFLAFGTVRSAIQSQQNNFVESSLSDFNSAVSEAAFRFDLFGNLYLTASERFLIGFRPLDQDGNFTRYTFDSKNPEFISSDCFDNGFQVCNDPEEFEDELNFGIRTLFFEGDVGELFPAADWADKKGLDIGFSIGRQPLSFQEGLLINEDAIDAIGLTRANLKFKGLVNVRATALVGWGDINRQLIPVNPENVFVTQEELDDINANLGRNAGDKSAILFGFFTETDTRKSTTEADIIFVSADDLQGDGLYLGVSNIRRIGRFNNTVRAVGSFTVGDEGLRNSQGFVLTNQFSWTPHHTHNHVYINLYAGIDEFRSAARGPATGGPLGLVGVLYSAVGIGRFPAALQNVSDNSVGGAFGYQMFFKETRQQLILELGARHRYEAPPNTTDYIASQVAGGGRYQIAVARRGVLVFDLFGLYNMVETDTNFDLNNFFVGGRFEVVVNL